MAEEENKKDVNKNVENKKKTNTGASKKTTKSLDKTISEEIEKTSTKNVDDTKEENNEVIKTDSKKEEKKEKIIDETKVDDTVSLKEIREALKSKVSENQKHNILKENIINILLAIVIVLYLIIVFMGSKKISIEILELDLKFFSISFAVIGLIILEIAYKKDNTKIAISGGEILIFAATNLCLMYVVKLHSENLLNTVTYISIAIGLYYIIKVFILSIKNTRKYKKDNNDIKEIIKK